MNYNKQIWNDLEKDERKAYKLYECFQKKMLDRGDKRKFLPSASSKFSDRDQYLIDEGEMYPADKIRNAKNFKYFLEVIHMYEDQETFDPYLFIEAVFRRIGKHERIYPAQLKTKANQQYYKDFRVKSKMSSEVSQEKQIMIDIMNTYKTICRRLGKDVLTFEDLYSFFNDVKDNNVISEGILFCIQEMISPFYFTVSVSFEEAWINLDQDIKDEIMSEDKYNNIRGVVNLKTRLYNFNKKLFGKDII